MITVEAQGKEFTFPDGTTNDQIGEALDQYFMGELSTPQPEEESIKEMFTGEKRQTEAIKGLQEVTGAPELGGLSEFSLEGLQQLGSNFTPEAFKAAGGLLLTSDPEKQAKIIKEQYPNATFESDEKGNIIVGLDSGKYVLNAPGFSTSDATSLVTNMLAFTPAGRAATVAKVGAGSALTEAGLQTAANVLADDEGVDLGDVALSGALGAGGKVAENLITGAARGATGADIPEDAAAAIRFAEENNAPLMTTDVIEPETFAGRSAQSFGEKVPGVGTADARARQQARRKELVDEYTARFGEYDPSSLYKSLMESTNAAKRKAGQQRGEVVTEMQGKPAAVQNTLDAIDDEIDRLLLTPGGVEKKTADTQTIMKLEDYRNDIMADPTFDNLEELRTQFRVGVRGERQLMPNRSEAAIENIYQSMTKDLDESIDLALGDEALEKWKQSNAVYAKEVDEVMNTRLKGVLNKGRLTPEAVNTLLYSKNPSEVKRLYKALNARGKKAARAGIIAKAVEKADKATGFSVERFLNELGNLSKNIDIVFEGEEKQMIDGLQKYLNATRQAAKADVVTPTGQQMMQLAPIADFATTGGAGTLAGLGYGAFARAYESKAVRNALLRLEGESPGTAEFERALKQVREKLNLVAQSHNRYEERESFYF